MMETIRFFQRLIFTTIVLLTLAAGAETADAQCYKKALQKAESLYSQKKYAEAKKYFTAAKSCPDRPKNNNLDSRITSCNSKLKQQSQSNSTSNSRSSSSSSSSSTSNSRSSSSSSSSSSTSTTKRSAKIESVWVDFDEYNNGEKGFRIHTKFVLYHMLRRTAHVAIYFKYNGGSYLYDTNGRYVTTDGKKVCVEDTCEPMVSESEHLSDFDLFMPYSELHLSSGRVHALAFDVHIYDEATQEDLAWDRNHEFWVTQP